MEKPPPADKEPENREPVSNPNAVFEWGVMIKNTDVPTTSENVYRQIKAGAVDDLMTSGVVRNAGSAGVGRVRKYGDRVYWTRGKDGEFHNVQPDHVVLEAPFSIASSRIVTVNDLVGIHARNESGEIENKISAISQVQEKQTENLQPAGEDSTRLSEVRNKLGLPSKE
ncbi:MAG: hypothetical protein WA014_01615 [Minisyncoccia bacterium]